MTLIKANNQEEYFGYQMILIGRFVARHTGITKLEAEMMWCSKFAKPWAKRHGRR